MIEFILFLKFQRLLHVQSASNRLLLACSPISHRLF